MARNRRNKREFKKILDAMSFKTFITLLIILITIIVVCLINIYYRNYKDKQLLAEQREELEKNIEAIFSETNKNIEDSKNTSIVDLDGRCGYVVGENEENIIDGKIKGCVPMYIKSEQSESWIAVTSMFATFYNIKTLITPPDTDTTIPI